MALPTFRDLFRIARDEVLVRNAQLSREAVEREGADANAIVATGAAMADEVLMQLGDGLAGLFLDSAERDALDRLVFDRYGLVRLPAANALVSVQFTTTAANPAAFTIPTQTLLSTEDGVQFVTTGPAVFPVASTGPILVTARSVLAGADQQVRKNTIQTIVAPVTGAPSDLAVNNPLASAGAADEETDASLRSRARNFFVNVRAGTMRAIEQGALAVAGVKKAKAFEALDSVGRQSRVVLLMITDAYTELLAEMDVSPVNYQAQSQQLAVSVFNGLSDVRAAGIYVHIQVAQVVLLSVRLSLQFRAGSNVDDVAMRARAAVVTAINATAPGTTVALASLRTALRGVAGLAYSGDEIVSPAGNVVPKALQAVRTQLALVTATAAQDGQAISATTNPDAYIVEAE